MRIDERQDPLTEARFEVENLDVMAVQSGIPEFQTVRRHGERHFRAQPVAVAAWRELRPWEESQVGPRVPFGVGVKKMVGAGIVLVDALFDETHSEDTGVEIEILLSRTRDCSNVM